MKARFDHVVIGASRLTPGTEQVEEWLGAATGGGGKHPLMATHNRLMRLRGSHGYLEIIAADPSAAAPSRPRWYGLDRTGTRDHLSQGPRALCWVAAVTDIHEAVSTCGYDAGDIITVTRGDLHWRLTVPGDGGLAADGILPALIQWPDGIDPVAALPAEDVGLAGIAATHPDPSFITDCMDRLGLAHMMTIASGPPSLAFDFSCPKGAVRIT